MLDRNYLMFLVLASVFLCSCRSDKDGGENKAETQTENSQVLCELGSAKGIGSISTIEGMLVAAGQDSCIYAWDWDNLEELLLKVNIKPQIWMSPWDRESRIMPINRNSMAVDPSHILYAAHDENDVTIVLMDTAGHQLNRWSVGRVWDCRRLCVTCNGKHVGVFLDVDIIRGVEGINKRRGGGTAYRLGVIHLESRNIRWLNTIWRNKLNQPGVYSAAVSEDGRYVSVVGSSGGGWISLADFVENEVLWERRPEGNEVPYGRWTVSFNAVSFSANGKRIYVGGDTGLFCFDAADGRILKQWIIPGIVQAMAISPDESLVAAGVPGRKEVYICDVKNTWRLAGPILQLRTGQDGIFSLAFSPDSTLLATGDIQKPGIKIWKMPAANSKPESGTPEAPR